MATDTDAIKELEYQMAAAAMCEETRVLVEALRRKMADCNPSLLIAMAIFLGEEIATSQRINLKNRQDYRDTVVELIHRAFDEARRA